MVFALGRQGMELPCTALKKWKKTNGEKMGGKKEIARERSRLSLAGLSLGGSYSFHVSLSRPELLSGVNIPFRTLGGDCRF